jgi:AmmeMemoRadiSam system protein B
MPDERPKLRPLDMIPLQAHGGQQFLLRDPQRLSSEELMVPPDIAYLLSQFDGTHTVREAQVSYVRRFGSLITTDKINDLLERLDGALLLDTDRFQEFLSGMQAEFRARSTRRAAHAGRSYDDGAAAFIQTWRPRLEAAAVPGDFRLHEQRPALIVPHYDMNGAAECYTAAYGALAEIPRPEVVVILGVAHNGGETPFALTRKPFETPFGALEADADTIDRLAEAAPFDVFADEFLHRDEHSVEFQTALLHFLYHDGDLPKIVPILCGGYHRQEGNLVDPATVPPADEFIQALREVVGADSRRVAVIASADLSHIGARFGQPPPLTQTHLDLARRHDTAILERAQAGDAEGMYAVLAEADDRYNVCGFPPIYALVRAVTPKEGHLLSYQQSPEPQTQSCVSFASVGLV